MYTVGSEHLPLPERTTEAIKLMHEILSFTFNAAHLQAASFIGEVFDETDNPNQFKVLNYQGLISGIVLDTSSFNVFLDGAWQQTALCDCGGPNVEEIFENYEQAMLEAQISQDLDNFAGTPTKDPHYEPLPSLVGTEVTIHFDRLGEYGIIGVMKDQLS